MEFTCNLCGQVNRQAEAKVDRETPGCSKCGSNVRTRALLYALSMELFGTSLTLPEFPRVASLRGIGTSDSSNYADRLAAKFDYRNTFHNREPRLDVSKIPSDERGKYDFVISSEVFEHVVPPAVTTFRNVLDTLKPHGVLVFTVPYSLELTAAEHFPELHEFGIANVGGRAVLVNRTREGALQVFENLIFHRDGSGSALEMREYSESSLKVILQEAGFTSQQIYTEDYPRFGIVHAEACSLPIAARKGEFAFRVETAREVVEQYCVATKKLDDEMQRLCRNFWFRLGHKLRLL
jgi:SAM-dependent methyltransferase